ncbi:hypothetical protein PSE_4572 [Pseudovibrio sp. FO-BEG1]|nr:hypothetical protein PSE_4572 [Pseudovibrio sp. FO-BEG1]
MGVGDVSAGEEERYSFYSRDLLKCFGKALAEFHDVGRKFERQVIKVVVMLQWDDLSMTGTDWAIVEKGHDLVIAVDLKNAIMLLSYFAKRAIRLFGHPYSATTAVP